MDFDHIDALRDLARQPPEPPKPPQRSAWGAVFRGAAGGAAQYGADVTQSIGAVPEDDYERRRRDRAGIPRPDYTGTAKGLRDFERDMRPDAATASTAESIVYGLSRGLTKAVGAVVTAGPVAGSAAFGASEAAAMNDDLARAGVDPVTRAKASALTGVASAASVLLPMSGPTLKSTAALYLAGGPGGFIAQQAGTQKILADAGYAKEASRFDPLDPVGLTLSALVPLPFAAVGAARNIRLGKALDTLPGRVQETPEIVQVPREATDAAMVHNLTVLADGHEAAIRSGEPLARVDAEVVEVPPVDSPVVPVRVEEQAGPSMGRLAETVDTARRLMDEASTQGKSLDVFLSERQVPAEVNNVMLGLKEAADDPRKMVALVQRLVREAQDTTKPASDATADAVQGMMALTEQQLNDMATPAKVTGDAVTQQAASRVEALRMEKPDMVSRVTDDGQQVRASDELDAAKREAFEGTDYELGAADADLLRVAAECALSLGKL